MHPQQSFSDGFGHQLAARGKQQGCRWVLATINVRFNQVWETHSVTRWFKQPPSDLLAGGWGWGLVLGWIIWEWCGWNWQRGIIPADPTHHINLKVRALDTLVQSGKVTNKSLIWSRSAFHGGSLPSHCRQFCWSQLWIGPFLRNNSQSPAVLQVGKLSVQDTERLVTV